MAARCCILQIGNTTDKEEYMSIVRSYGRISMAALWLLSTLGCSSLSDTPRVDLTGEDKARYETDLKACQASKLPLTANS